MGLDASVYADDDYENELAHERLGNVAFIELVRGELAATVDLFPVLQEKVIHSATHTGDQLNETDVRKLREEMNRLAQWPETENKKHLERLRVDLTKLCDIAIKHGRPIQF